jgi:CobQ-like glutamine amidotransferase family enzyme
VHGRVVGTYLHGPVLARNPRLADRLLEWVVGPLEQFDDPQADLLHEERRAELIGARVRGRSPGLPRRMRQWRRP